MIHILFGGNTLNKNIYIKELTDNSQAFVYSLGEINKEIIMSHANNVSLFGEAPVVILEDILKDGEIIFSNDELMSLKESPALFILKEEKLLVADQKKYTKYCELKNFEEKKVAPVQKFNIFSLTDAFANRDKMTTWLIYKKGIESGLEPEAISGILFWKIKTMLLNGNRFFDKRELMLQSSQIVSLYHKAHRGESDFAIGIEVFILKALSSK